MESSDEENDAESFFNPDMFTKDVKQESMLFVFDRVLKVKEDEKIDGENETMDKKLGSKDSISVNLLCIHQSNQFVAKFVPRVVWPSAVSISEWLARIDKSEIFHNLFSDKSVIELGSGTGLAGIVLGKCTAAPKRIILTDCDDSSIKILKKNAINNPGNCGKVDVMKLLWGNKDHIDEAIKLNDGKLYDIVLATDVIYDDEAISPLLETASMILKPPTTSHPNGGIFLLANHVSRYAGLRKAVESRAASLPFQVTYNDPLGEDKSVTFMNLKRTS